MLIWRIAGRLANVLERPRLRKYFTLAQARAFVVLFRGLGESIELDLDKRVPQCRDPKDDYLLQMAEVGKADVLVTGDKDLLDMGGS